MIANRPDDLELRITDGRMRWKVQPEARVEVWSGPTLVGTLSGGALVALVELQLATAAMAARLQAGLAALPTPPPAWRAPLPAALTDPAGLAMRKPLAALPERRPIPDRAQRAALAAQRRQRSRGR